MALIGTTLVEDLVQTVACSHLIAERDRVGLLLLAAPESGKTTIACAARSKHVHPVSVITARSVLAELANKDTEFFLFNDMAAIRSLSKQTSALLIVILNQIVNGETGIASFAGQTQYKIERPIGIIGCMPFKLFADKRSAWREMGFVSRMLTFSYSYGPDIVAKIKNGIDLDRMKKAHARPMPAVNQQTPVHVTIHRKSDTRLVRTLADKRAEELGQVGIRMLHHYHTLVRAHALKHGRVKVNDDDMEFLTAVDQYVSITECRPL